MPATAEVVGIALRVNRHVKGFILSGEPLREELQPRNLIERGLRVILINKEAALQIELTPAFGCHTRVEAEGAQKFSISSVLTILEKSEVQIGKNPCDPKIQLPQGKIRLAMLPGSGYPLQIETSEATTTINGAYLRVLAEATVGTFVAVDQGKVTVKATAGGSPVEVKAGNWVLVPPGGLPTRPAPLPPSDDDEILQDPPLCCGIIDLPKPPADSGSPR